MSWKESFSKGISSFKTARCAAFLPTPTTLWQAVRLGCDQYVVYDSRSAVYEKLERRKEGLKDSKMVIDLAPDRWQGYARSARLFLGLHKHDAALKMVEFALDRVKAGDTKRHVELTALKTQILESRSMAVERQRELTVKTACHFGNLPVEMISEIFLTLAEYDHVQAITVSHVCSLWRAVALGIPALWKTLVLAAQRSEKKFHAKAREWLKRSRGHIEQLSLSGDTMRLSPAEELGFRWDWLKVCKIQEPYTTDIIARNPSFSSLEELELKGFGNWNLFLEKVLDSKLRKFSLHDGVFSWAPLAKNFRELEYLSITQAKTPSAGLFSVLETNPNLRTVILKCLCIGGLPAPPALIHMPHLTHLELSGDAPATIISAYVMAPSLQLLHLEQIHPSANTILDNFQRMGHLPLPLTSLIIDRCHVLAALLINFLRTAAPALEVLKLCAVDGQANRVLEALAGPSLPPSLPGPANSASASTSDPSQLSILCPALTSVDFSRCPDIKTGPLVRLVKGRLDTNPPATSSQNDQSEEILVASPAVKSITSLVVDGCPMVEVSVLPWLRSKVPHFSCVYMSKNGAAWKR